jgi:hypothetical protein
MVAERCIELAIRGADEAVHRYASVASAASGGGFGGVRLVEFCFYNVNEKTVPSLFAPPLAVVP